MRALCFSVLCITNYKKYNFRSEAPFKLDDVRYPLEVKENEVVKVLECDWKGICETPLVFSASDIKLGTFGVSDTKTVYLWYIPEEEEVPPKGVSWIAKLLDWGKKFEVKGFMKYIVGWFSVKDIETGKLYITTGRIIVLLIGLSIIVGMMIFIVYWRKKKTKLEL